MIHDVPDNERICSGCGAPYAAFGEETSDQIDWQVLPASYILSRVARRLPGDWQLAYGYQPVLLETFVESARFTGASYRAANWIRVGQTKGRGKLDRYNQYALSVT
ncbi:hypothetical protein B1A_09487, partial [mine drainage metagenome]